MAGRFSSGGPSYWKKKTFTINGSSSTDVIAVEQSAFRGLKAHISVYKTDDTKLTNFEYNLHKKNSQPKDTISGKFGDIIDYEIDSSISGSQYVTTITNNESSSIKVTIFQLFLV